MNLPDNLMLGGALLALDSILMAVMAVYLGEREERKKQARNAAKEQHSRPSDSEDSS